MSLELSFDSLNSDELRGSTQADYLISLDGTFRISSGEAVLIEEPGFPVVELAWKLAPWIAVPSPRFRFESMSLEEVGTVEITQQAGGWVVSSCYAPMRAVGPLAWPVVESAVSEFIGEVEASLIGLDLNPAEVLRHRR